MGPTEHLKLLIDNWLEKDSKRNLKRLAKLSDVAYGTILTTYHNKNVIGIVDAFKLLKLLLQSPADVQNFVETHFAAFSSPVLADDRSEPENENSSLDSLGFSDECDKPCVISEVEGKLILMLLSNKILMIENLETILGTEQCHRFTNLLLKRRYVRRSENRLILIAANIVLDDNSIIDQAIGSVVSGFDESVKGNFRKIIVSKVTHSALESLFNETENFANKAADKAFEPENQGEFGVALTCHLRRI